MGNDGATASGEHNDLWSGAPTDLSGQVVLLAGATGAVGGAFARAVLQRGGKVAAAVRRPWQVSGLQTAKRPTGVGSDHLLVGCVGAVDGEAAAGFVKGAQDSLGEITAFVSTAGTFRANPVGKEPAGELQELLEANLLSSAVLVRAVLGRLRRRGSGSLTFVGSAGVGGPQPFAVNYLASKAALHEYVRALAATEQANGLRVGAILPGTIDTAANREAMPTAAWPEWTSIETVVRALLAHAFGPPIPGGPLYAVRN